MCCSTCKHIQPGFINRPGRCTCVVVPANTYNLGLSTGQVGVHVVPANTYSLGLSTVYSKRESGVHTDVR